MSAAQLAFPGESVWIPTRDGDFTVRGIFDRHYSRRKNKNANQSLGFVGPGEKIVLRTAEADAIFIWLRQKYRQDDQSGVNCSVFRNEGARRSSELIRLACDIGWERWPGKRLFTFVDGGKVRSSNPGFCYLMAGWRKCGTTKRGLQILEILPDD